MRSKRKICGNNLRAILASKKVRRAYVLSDQFPAEDKDFNLLDRAYDPLWDTLSFKSAIEAGRTATYINSKKYSLFAMKIWLPGSLKPYKTSASFLVFPSILVCWTSKQTTPLIKVRWG